MAKYIFAILLAIYANSNAQKTKIADIYQAAKTVKEVKSIISTPTNKTFNLDIKTPKNKTQQIGDAVVTSNIAIYKSNQLPVYQTKSGKLFIVYENKDNTGYNKKYIKPEDYK